MSTDTNLKTGDLVWICIWDETSTKFIKVCGTIVQSTDVDCFEIFASAMIFVRSSKEINIFNKKADFLSWPFNNVERNMRINNST
jgi:hypothetical protein